MRVPFALMVLSCFVLPAAAQAQTRPGDAALGKALALKSCSSCHVVAEGQSQAGIDGVPAFAALANRPDFSTGAAAAFMQAPHPPMPDLSLTRTEIDDIAAYIASLRKR